MMSDKQIKEAEKDAEKLYSDMFFSQFGCTSQRKQSAKASSLLALDLALKSTDFEMVYHSHEHLKWMKRYIENL